MKINYLFLLCIKKLKNLLKKNEIKRSKKPKNTRLK